jgi:transposase
MASYKQSDYEALRRRCVELSQADWQQLAIAQAFGLTQPWVSRTLKKYREQGVGALQEGKRTGAPTRLSVEQLGQLVTELHKGAEHHGFSGAVWTRPRINEVVKKLFGVSYDPSQIGRILKRVGWSRQKPQRKASQQNPQAVAHWREERLPELNRIAEAKKLKMKDESACYLLPLLAHTWAPCGQTPVLVQKADRAHLSLIAAIAPNGRIYVAGQDQSFTSEDIVWFLN